jgi:UDP-N-acetylmuramate--alanine ligase
MSGDEATDVTQTLAGGRSAAVAERPRRAHLVGIAGAGMSSLARLLLDWGWTLSGSDCALSGTADLAARGVALHEGHAGAYLPDDADLVVRSDAIGDDNPELASAAARDIPIHSYFEMLASLGRGRWTLAVAGTHGKSTTTAMATEIFVRAGLDPTAIYGATPIGRQSGARVGRSRWMLVEACEYRANFLKLRPQSAVVLGIEPDHLDYYGSVEAVQAAFARFVARVPAGGLVLVRHECAAARNASAGAAGWVETFGLDPRAGYAARDLRPRAGRYAFELVRHGDCLGQIRLQVPGRHQVLNALAAAALALEHQAGMSDVVGALEAFRGLRRRLEVRGVWRGVDLVDDYAHHPTEVAATLATIREMYPQRRVWCVFQPHQAWRTANFLDDFAASLQNTDQLLVAEIFRAREPPPRPGEVTAALLAAKAAARGVEVMGEHEPQAIARRLRERLVAGDVLVTIGAGDIGKIHSYLDPRGFQ